MANSPVRMPAGDMGFNSTTPSELSKFENLSKNNACDSLLEQSAETGPFLRVAFANPLP
jgi:hypothetical protein